MGGRPYVVAAASGAHITDVEGRRYIDLVQVRGRHPRSRSPSGNAGGETAAVDGTSYGAAREMTRKQLRTSPELRTRSIHELGYRSDINRSSPAAYTGRDRVVIFHGNFHGATDALLAAGGGGVATLGLWNRWRAGRCRRRNDGAPYNVVPQLDEAVAAVIVEPVAANMGVVEPVPDSLKVFVKSVIAPERCLFLMSHFWLRLGPGGAQERYGGSQISPLSESHRRRAPHRSGWRHKRSWKRCRHSDRCSTLALLRVTRSLLPLVSLRSTSNPGLHWLEQRASKLLLDDAPQLSRGARISTCRDACRCVFWRRWPSSYLDDATTTDEVSYAIFPRHVERRRRNGSGGLRGLFVGLDTMTR